MRASFIHLADTHLGYEQYGVRERFNDFSKAFWEVTDAAIERNVDFVIIAGDLFHKRAIDALTLIHATEGLKKLQEQNIPVIAIEGNHDRSYYRDGTSWLQFLCYQGYLMLLAPTIRDGAPVLEPWDKESMRGAYVDLLGGKLRVYGLHWVGASIGSTLEGMARALATKQTAGEEEGIVYRVLAMHTGIDGEVPRMQGLPTRAKFQTLQPYIHYLALGHVHKPYTDGGWIYNPGSTETCGAEEIQWDDRGYYYVEIDTEQAEHITDPSQKVCVHRVERIKTTRRSFVRYDLRVDSLHDPDALYTRLEEYCRRESVKYHALEARPLVQVHLVGTLGFDAGSLDQQRMEQMVSHYFQPLHVRVEDHTNDQDYAADDGELDGRDRSVWHELERYIFEELLGRDNRYLPAREQWSTVVSEIKAQALRKDDPQAIAQFLREKRAELLGG